MLRLMIEYEDFDESHLLTLSDLAASEGWDSFRDPALVRRALAAPGCIVVVAVEGGRPVAFIQIQSDGGIHAHISNILVAETLRGQGVGRRLVEIAFDRSGAKYIDLVSTEGSDDFYRSFVHEEFPGFRLYPHRTED